MKTLSIILFCILSLGASIGLSYALYPHASMPAIVVGSDAKPMEEFDQTIDLGKDYGEMTVIDLMGYYLENPPVQNSASALEVPKRHFGGC